MSHQKYWIILQMDDVQYIWHIRHIWINNNEPRDAWLVPKTYYYFSVIYYHVFLSLTVSEIKNITAMVWFVLLLLETMPLPPLRLQPRAQSSLLKRLTLGIIDEAGHHVRPAGVCEEGTVPPQGEPRLGSLTKERMKGGGWELLHASLPAWRDWCEEKCLGGEESALGPSGAPSVEHLSPPSPSPVSLHLQPP